MHDIQSSGNGAARLGKDMKLVFKIKPVYGRILYEPVSTEAKAIMIVAEQKTATESDLKVLKDGGFELEIRPFGERG